MPTFFLAKLAGFTFFKTKNSLVKNPFWPSKEPAIQNLTIVLCSRSERTFPQAFASSSDVRLLASMEPSSFFVISSSLAAARLLPIH
jgi:hypothetical protein